jgi:Arc/MetJ-type ribon-helix-helix transcriptional regulator
MKNITVSVDEETYRRARIVAAERNSSVSALVRDYLRSLGAARAEEGDDVSALFAALDKARGFRASTRLTREEAHARGRLP